MNTFLREIYEQPAALRRMLDHYVGQNDADLLTARDWLRDRCRPVVFTGMGTALYVCHAAASLLNRHGYTSFVWDTSELLHYNLEGLPGETLLVAVSQSGESAETCEIVRRLGGRVRTLGVTNRLDSFIGRHTDLALPLLGGPQEAVGTKTNTLHVALLVLLAYATVGRPVAQVGREIYGLADSLERLLVGWETRLDPVVELTLGAPYVACLGRGPALSSALLSAIVLKEAAQVCAEGMPAGEFRHGPMELIGPAHCFVVFAPSSPTRPLNLRLVGDILHYGGRVVLFSAADGVPAGPRLLHWASEPCDEYLSPIVDIVPMQLLAYRLGDAKGLEAGRLTKARPITREE